MKFNFTRFVNLIKRDFITHKKNILYICSGIWGFLAGAIAINYASNNNPSYSNARFWVPIMLGLLLIGGLTFTAMVFKEFKTPGGRLQFLSLPASNLEKVMSRWLYSLILLPLFITGSVWLVSSFCLAEGESIWYQLGEARPYLPWLFVLLHAFTFLLALFFNKLVPVKVLLTSAAVNIISVLLVSLIFILIFREYIDFQGQVKLDESMTMSRDGQSFFEYTVFPKLKFIAYFILAPFLWIVSYFKMKEKEA